MTSLLSSVSGHLGRGLMLGTLLPTAIFVALGTLLMPNDVAAIGTTSIFGIVLPESDAIRFSFVVIAISGALYHANTMLIQLYEGYPWQRSTVGAWRTAVHRRRRENAEARWLGYPRIIRALGQDPLGLAAQSYRSAQGRALMEFPDDPSSILPTTLGNVIRAFETYPRSRYGMSAIPLWPRLIAVMDAPFADGISQAKTAFDFMLNSSFLSAALCVVHFAVTVARPFVLYSPIALATWIIQILALAGSAAAFYVLAVGRARAWGEMVRAAFDLYRWALLEQLGYRDRPKTLAEERATWETISQPMIFPPMPGSTSRDYEPRGTVLTTKPAKADVTICRGIGFPDQWQRQTITVEVKGGSSAVTASSVFLTERLPNSFLYEWGSAQLNGKAATVTGTNPYCFHLGALDAGATLMLSFRVVPGLRDSKGA
jgi:hypothetical protein